MEDTAIPSDVRHAPNIGMIVANRPKEVEKVIREAFTPPQAIASKRSFMKRFIRAWTHGDLPGSTLMVLVSSLFLAIFIVPPFLGDVWWAGLKVLPFVTLEAFPMFLGSLLVIGLVMQLHAIFALLSRIILIGKEKGWWKTDLGSKLLGIALNLAVFEVWSGCGADEKDPAKRAEQRLLGYYGMNYLFRRRHHISYILDVLPHVFWKREWRLELASTPLEVLKYRYYHISTEWLGHLP